MPPSVLIMCTPLNSHWWTKLTDTPENTGGTDSNTCHGCKSAYLVSIFSNMVLNGYIWERRKKKNPFIMQNADKSIQNNLDRMFHSRQWIKVLVLFGSMSKTVLSSRHRSFHTSRKALQSLALEDMQKSFYLTY